MIRNEFKKYVGQTSESPLQISIEGGEGPFLISAEGNKIIDFISGISVSSLGHGNPRIIKAIQNQAAKYLHTMVYGEFVISPQVEFAKALIQELGHPMEQVFFVNSGSEAIEGALKLAKKSTGRSKIVACHNSYHGSTHGALSVTGCDPLKEGYGPFLPGVDFVEFNKLGDLEKITNETAAFLIEPIQGEAGIIEPSEEYLIAARDICDKTGTLLIFDEIQTGFGRTGEMFYFQGTKVVPDIITLGKALGGGMPLAAFISSQKVMHVLTHNPVLGHITTFGGHPVCCAAGFAALQEIKENNLLKNIQSKETIIRNELNIPEIKEIKGKGLFLAVYPEKKDTAMDAIDYCVKNGLLVDWFLHCTDAIRLAPPLNISDSVIIDACAILKEGIKKHCR